MCRSERRPVVGRARRSLAAIMIASLTAAIAACSDTTPTRSGTPPHATASTAPTTADRNAAAHPAASWIDTVQSRLAASEYAIRDDGAGTFHAVNRAQGLRAAFDAHGLAVRAREGDEASTVRIGVRAHFDGSPFTEGACRADGAVDDRGRCLRRVERTMGSATEWFENGAEGIEHGVTFAERPANEPDGLVVAVGIEGATVDVDADGHGASLTVNTRRMRYAQLAVHDANGRALPSVMRAASGGLEIRVDDHDATFPVTIDPLLTTAVWYVEGNQNTAQFGSTVASAGDVNADGFSDVLVSAPLFDNGETDEGRAYLFLGGPSGLSLTPAWTAESNEANGHFGLAIAPAGDINADGYSDVVVTTYVYGVFSGTPAGRLFVYLGGPSGLPSTASTIIAPTAPANAGFGGAVAGAGDVNGDGYADVLVGTPAASGTYMTAGGAVLYLGTASGLSATSAWRIEGDQAGAQLGTTVAGAGDVNGDGFADVLVASVYYTNGQTNEGRAHLYLGSGSGLASTPAWTAESDQTNAYFGRSIATAGDVNGDGFADVAVGAPNFDNGQTDEGRVFVYLGAAAGLSATPAWMAESDQAGAHFGASAASAGDVNGDGFGDLIVGVPEYANGEAVEGRFTFYFGSAAGLAATAATAIESNRFGTHMGNSVASAGDVNGDGLGDVIVGGFYVSNVESIEGSAFLYLGAASGLGASSGWTAESDQASAAFAVSARSAGDVNGDGFDDVVVGAETFDNGESDEGRAFLYLGGASGLATTAAWTAEGNQASAQFGHTVSGAGDVNGDGFDDVIVGANFFDNGQFNEGRVYVYLGRATGLDPMPAWFAEADQSGALFGSSVASAGDVNGDGYADIAIGAYLFDNGETNEGRAFVYLGSATGLASTPTWTGESDQANAQYGWSVASAGDVNGDGFDDLIVGAQYFDNPESDEGKAYVYLGGSSGLSVAPAWTTEGNAMTAVLGASVASAGDVNADGYGDVIVGATSIVNEGRAYVFLGGPTGLATSASWTGVPGQTSSAYGGSVASAGDVNGDGFGDVIVGASYFDNVEANEGRAFVYLGSTSGLGASPAWTAESNQLGAQLGASVASAGDVNGDGYSDVIVGAPLFDNGQTDEGRAFVFFGNGGDGTGIGLPLRPQLRRPASTTPIAPRGRAAGSSVDVAALSARSPMGRTRARVEFEVRALGAPFTGTSLTRSSAWIDTTTLGATIAGTASGLSGSTAYHWRARLVYDATRTATWLHSRWLYGGVGGEPRSVHFRTVDLCAGVTCTPSDSCHIAGTCNPATGTCSNPVAADGTSCTDNNGCTRTDTCQAGVCMGANPIVCTPSDSCHAAGICDPRDGTCSNPVALDGAACSDGNACTQRDTCMAGACVGANPVACTASDACHVAGVCDPASGVCNQPAAPDGTACDDGNTCTQTDTCAAGVCLGNSPVACVATDACHLPGTCDPATGMCGNPRAPDGTACNDGNACTQTDVCVAGACTAGTPVICTASDACHVVGTCDPATGACSNPTAVDGSSCDDGNACTMDDTCTSGTCSGVPACFDGGGADAEDAEGGADGNDAEPADASVDVGPDEDASNEDASNEDASNDADDALQVDANDDAGEDARTDAAADAPAADVPTTDSATEGGADGSRDAASDGPDAGTLPNRGSCACSTPGRGTAPGALPAGLVVAIALGIASTRRRFRRRSDAPSI